MASRSHLFPSGPWTDALTRNGRHPQKGRPHQYKNIYIYRVVVAHIKMKYNQMTEETRIRFMCLENEGWNFFFFIIYLIHFIRLDIYECSRRRRSYHTGRLVKTHTSRATYPLDTLAVFSTSVHLCWVLYIFEKCFLYHWKDSCVVFVVDWLTLIYEWLLRKERLLRSQLTRTTQSGRSFVASHSHFDTNHTQWPYDTLSQPAARPARKSQSVIVFCLLYFFSRPVLIYTHT